MTFGYRSQLKRSAGKTAARACDFWVICRSQKLLVSCSMTKRPPQLSSVEICAGAGGQALGLEAAGFHHAVAVELDGLAWETLRQNRPSWNPRLADAKQFDATPFRGADLFAGGVPCPPFSVAGKQLGANDERDLFPTALRMVEEVRPTAVMLENVPGFGSRRFDEYRSGIMTRLRDLGFDYVDGRILQAADFGVAQLRPRFVLVALRGKAAKRFAWPAPISAPRPTVGDCLIDLMGSRGWRGAQLWRQKANGIAPTLVGGSKLHGGPDLGPSRAKAAWRLLGVDGGGVADFAPDSAFPVDGAPKLTVRMTARLQGFPDSWQFAGRKTAMYRQVGNAFPPPVAEAVGRSIATAILGQRSEATSHRSEAAAL